MVKNTVIVPVGSKGGFVLKRAPPATDREAFMKEGVACYQDYLRGLLDLTDNRVGDRIVPPPQVKRHDADDPYLVVAADKGTATFSDYANGISEEYGFWLGDAFASGGSVGYDHKAMGITARGAWESVKRHFRELGVDTQTTDFTVAGIGDMSGDVFGNGMLLSRAHPARRGVRPPAHLPRSRSRTPAASFAERERLFRLPRSSWADYDARLALARAAASMRAARSRSRSRPRSRRRSAIDGRRADADRTRQCDPEGAGRPALQRRHRHLRQGERARRTRRSATAPTTRCASTAASCAARSSSKAATSAARSSAASSTRWPAGASTPTRSTTRPASTRPTTRSTSRSCSASPIADGELTEKQRNALLAEMTDDVAALVLRDNYFQTQVLSVTGRIAPRCSMRRRASCTSSRRRAGSTARSSSCRPTSELAERRAQGRGLTSPEHAVLLAYSKIWLYDELLASPLPDDPWVATALARYFPAGAAARRYAAYMARHPLKREIIATHVTNSMINRVGSTFVHRLMRDDGRARRTRSCAPTC